ncbi:glutathione transferase GST 23-like [Salvia hispanica]|uniref:glutathione transferase GST 23-like n=1 Tax=Salvia hispanica TaxID=49212 RepID=UPI00200928C9|nr:glutathione transferase GST 23-like [Salvia hispanica]
MEVRLHGMWASPYVIRVIWALKLKGVKYEYIEEDLSNKSMAVLEYNPIHKKVPVLVHNGKPIVESAVILQYIEETWPDRTPLLPEDPYERAMARFWIDFGQQKSLTFFAFFLTSEEDKHKTAAQVLETLKILEEEALGDKKFFGGNTINMVDLFFGWLTYSFGCMENISGVQVLLPETLPRLHRWTLDFKQEPVIKENLPDSTALLEHFKRVTKHLKSSNKFKPA